MKTIYIADPEILQVPIVESHETLIDLKDQTILKYGPPPENEWTAPDYTKLRKTVYDKLCKAQADLSTGWAFRVYEGFRSINVQQRLFDEEYSRVKIRNPSMNHADCFRETTRLISPVKNLDGSMNIPPHNTGAAVDVEIINTNGELIDMGMAIKDWVMVDPDLCLTKCATLGAIAQQNRHSLLQVMEAHGFVNYPMEWWHFSYGDRYWAYHKQKDHAIYGPVG